MEINLGTIFSNLFNLKGIKKEETKNYDDVQIRTRPYSANAKGKDVTNPELKQYIMENVATDENKLTEFVDGDNLVTLYKSQPIEGIYNGILQTPIEVVTALDTTANASVKTAEQKQESGVALYGAFYDTASKEQVKKPANDTISATAGKTFADIVKENYGVSPTDAQINAYYGQILEANRDNINWDNYSDVTINTSFESSKTLTSLNIPDETQVSVNGEAMTFGELKNNVSKYEKIEGLLDNLNVSFDLKDAASADLAQFADKDGNIVIDGQKHVANDINKAEMFGRNGITINGVRYDLENEIDYGALKDVDISSLFKSSEIELPDISQENGTTSNLEKTDEITYDYRNYPQNITLQDGESLEAAIARTYQVQEGSVVANYLLNQVVQDKGNDKLFKSTGTERFENALELSANGNLKDKTIALPQQDMVFEIFSRQTNEKPNGTKLNDVLENDESKYFNFLRNDQDLSTKELSTLNDKIQDNQSGMINYGAVKNQLLTNQNSEAIALLDELWQEKGSNFTQNDLQAFLQKKSENSGDNTKLNQILAAYTQRKQEYANDEVMNYALSQYFAPNTKENLSAKSNDKYKYSEYVAVAKEAIIKNNPDVFNADGSLKFNYTNTLSQIKNIVIPDVIYNLNEEKIVESSDGGGGDNPDPPCGPTPDTPTDYT